MIDLLKKHWKLLTPFLFALAVLLGLAQRKTATRIYNSSDNAKLRQELVDFYNRGQELNPQTQTESKISFLAVGDIMLSRNVAAEIQKSNNVNLPFGPMADILKSTDFNFGNLESPISPPPSPPQAEGGKNSSPPPVGGVRGGGIVGGHSLIFGAPENYAAGLVNYNFKILNLANNHAFDEGLTGLNFTRKFLDQNGVKHTGTGDSLDEAWQPAVVTANGIKICFVGASYASINDGGKSTNNYVARIEDVKKLKIQISNAKQTCDFIVVSMHAGTEYTRTPNKSQADFAHAAIDDGADLVIGAHPHWVQTIEKYCPLQSSSPGEEKMSAFGGQMRSNCSNPKYIFYSLGNFIFDQEWSRETKEGLALKIQISKNQMTNAAAPNAATMDDLQGTRLPAKLDSIELMPIILENYSTPRPATAEEAKQILEKIGIPSPLLPLDGGG